MNLVRKAVRAGSLAVVAIVLAATAIGCTAPAKRAGTTYYVDPAVGRDTSSGTSTSAPWRSLSRAGRARLRPGDTLALAAGGRWAQDALDITASGTAAAPITITRYGTDSRDPEVTGQRAGYCFLLHGSYLVLRRVRAVGCGYPDAGTYGGIGVWGSKNVVRDSYVGDEAVGIFIKDGSNGGLYTGNTLVDNNIENVDTAGVGCATPTARNCSDDSGSFGFLIHGDSNEVSWNTVSGSAARSYDWGIDGGAFEVFNGNDNDIHHNFSIDNNNFSELGHAAGRTAVRNRYSYNLIRATCGAMCTEARGLIVRGGDSNYGPNTGTEFSYNTFYADGPAARGITCHAGCSPSILTLRGNIIVVTGGVTGAWSVWSDAPFTERENVLNGPYTGFALDSSTSTAAVDFVDPPTDLHITASSPAVGRAGTSSFSYDLDRKSVPSGTDCAAGARGDSGAYALRPARC